MSTGPGISQAGGGGGNGTGRRAGCRWGAAAASRPGRAATGPPEIKLGIIPGAGGTQRLPRAIGVEQALQLITTGAFIDATKGAAAGLIDKVADGDVVAAAVAFARE
jgi:3-hydroxyacyl-CoA dehydrogenase